MRSNDEVHENHVKGDHPHNPNKPGEKNEVGPLRRVWIKFEVSGWESERHQEVAPHSQPIVLVQGSSVKQNSENKTELGQENNPKC